MEAVDRVEVVEVTSYCYEDNFCDVLVYQPQAQASEVVALLAEVAESLEKCCCCQGICCCRGWGPNPVQDMGLKNAGEAGGRGGAII